MITPDNQIPPDDSENSEADDQQSQKDIHSNGLDETVLDENTTNPDILRQSYDAAEASYTLDLDDDDDTSDDDTSDDD